VKERTDLPRPAYADLGNADGSPPGSAWAVYGAEDAIGSIGLLTAEKVRAAAKLVTRGAAFSLNWSLDLPSPPLFGRKQLKHTTHFDEAGADDVYDSFYPQCSSQWDGLSHIQHPKHGFYQGWKREDIAAGDASRLGVEKWAERGITGRFVLADVERYRQAIGRPIRPDRSDAVTIQEIEMCLARQGSELSEADILLVRFGWTRWYEHTDEATRRKLASDENFSACGLSRSEETAAWVWDRKLAAIAGDNPALEVQPFDVGSIDGFLHYRLIPMLGIAIGEMFALDALAADCCEDGRYEGMLVSAPLNKPGGCGSTANALALK